VSATVELRTLDNAGEAAKSCVFDNPVTGRELRFGLRPGRLMVLLTIHSAILLLTLLVVNRLYTWHEIRRELSPFVSFGSSLLFMFGIIECAWLTLYLPFRSGSVLLSDRRNRCLDQIAASGLSPLTIYRGHLGTTMGAVMLFLISSLPFFGLCVFFGGVTAGQVAATLCMVLCFAVALSCVSMAAGVFHRFLSALGVIPLVVVLGCMAVAPDRGGLPTVTMAISPVRSLLFMVATQTPDFQRFFWEPKLAETTVPCWLLSSVYFLVIALIACGYLLIGPSVFLTPGLNDFDAVTIGSRKGKRQSRWKGRLFIRKIQLAFLYENRSAWVKRISPWLRVGLMLLLTIFVFSLLGLSVAPHVKAANPATWSEGWNHLLLWHPLSRTPGSPDEPLMLYGVVMALWAALVLPAQRRTTRDLLETDQPLCLSHTGRTCIHLFGLAIPLAMLPLVLWLNGKQPYAAMRVQITGLWLIASAYSLTIGSLVVIACTRVRYPPTATTVAVLIILSGIIVPLLWYPFYLFGLLPGPVCHASMGSLPIAWFVTQVPWERLDFHRFVGSTYRFRLDWRHSLWLFLSAAACTMLWSEHVVRKLRKNEKTGMADDDGDEEEQDE